MKKILISVAFFVANFAGMAQVGIGTTKPEGALDVVSANSGLIVPRVANTAAVTSPVNGMIIYDLSTNCIKAYENTSWTDCLSKMRPLTSADVLAQIGNEGDNPDTVNSEVSVAELGNITPTLTGLDAGNETAYQDYIDANPDSFSSPATQAEVQAMVDAVNAATDPSVYCSGSATIVVDVVGAGGATWMDRNLGATQVATSSSDTDAYGDLYQWGRFTDGHQCIDSDVTSTNSTTDTPGMEILF